MSQSATSVEPVQYSELTPVSWELINSLENNCSGRVACIFDGNYSAITEAVKAGALCWSKQHITSKDQLAGVLVGFALYANASCSHSDLYFLNDEVRTNKALVNKSKVFVIDLLDESNEGESTKTTLTIDNQGISIAFEGHSDYVSGDDEGQPIYSSNATMVKLMSCCSAI